MKIDALKLLDGPLTVDVDESVHVLQSEDEPAYEFIEGVTGRVVFSRMLDGKVLVRGTLKTRVRTACVRCLEPIELNLGAGVTLVYAHDADLLDESKRLEFPDDVLYYDGHEIEPLNDLRELLLLELPAYPSCDLVPGRVCAREALKSGPVTFGSAGNGSDEDASRSRQADEEPEWKAALRRVSDARSPKTT